MEIISQGGERVEPIKVLVDQEILVRLEDKIDCLLSNKVKEDDEVLNAQQVADLGGVSLLIVIADAIFGRMFDKEMERRMGDE